MKGRKDCLFIVIYQTRERQNWQTQTDFDEFNFIRDKMKRKRYIWKEVMKKTLMNLKRKKVKLYNRNQWMSSV